MPQKTHRVHSPRKAINVSPSHWQKLVDGPSLWTETDVEIKAGLAWGQRKARLLEWVRNQMEQRLTKRERLLIKRVYLDGRSAVEAANETGLHRSTVNRVTRRAIRKLREAAAREGLLVK